MINLAKTWEKLMLAARIIVAIENPADGVCAACSSGRTRSCGQERVVNEWRGAPKAGSRNTVANSEQRGQLCAAEQAGVGGVREAVCQSD